MRPFVVVDATPYGREPSGARRRFDELLPRVARLRPDAVFEVHWPRDGATPGPDLVADNVVHVRTDTSCTGGALRWWRRSRALARRHREAPFTHCWVDHGPLVRPDRVRNLVTVHDLRFLHGYGGRLRGWYGRRRYGGLLRRAAAVVAVSDAIGDELRAVYGVRDAVVARNAPAAGFSREALDRVDDVLRARGIARPYLLVVGRDEPRKAMAAALDAWRRARADGASYRLVVVGSKALAGDGVVAVPRTTDAELAALYAGASFTLVPSRYEGYSLPVVESLACGTPVIASDIAAHRALVAGGARGLVLVPPPAPAREGHAWPAAAAALKGPRGFDAAPPAATWDDAAAAVAAALLRG